MGLKIRSGLIVGGGVFVNRYITPPPELLNVYIVDVNEVNFADYGVPQNRKRLITIVTKNKKLINFLNMNTGFFAERALTNYERLEIHWD